jgi:hypothetical protein
MPHVAVDVTVQMSFKANPLIASDLNPHLEQCRPCYFFTLGLSTKILYAFVIYPACLSSPFDSTALSLFFGLTAVIFADKYKLRSYPFSMAPVLLLCPHSTRRPVLKQQNSASRLMHSQEYRNTNVFTMPDYTKVNLQIFAHNVT